MESVEFIWHIPHFRTEFLNTFETQELPVLLSPTFSFEGKLSFDAVICVFPMANIWKKEAAIFVFIVDKRRSTGHCVELSVLDKAGLKRMRRQFTIENALQHEQGITECLLQSELSRTAKEIKKNISWRTNLDFMYDRTEQVMDGFVQNDTLIIYCKVSTEHFSYSFPLINISEITYQSRPIQEDHNKKKLITDLESLLFNPTKADVVFSVENSKLFAHKIILAATCLLQCSRMTCKKERQTSCTSRT